MLEFTQGDMFEAPADIRVNTVNCVGVMGAGVALAFKQRYPQMFKDYQLACKDGRVRPGRMDVWKSLDGDWIVNFPTKRDWRDPSRYEDIDAGLDDLRGYLDSVGPVTVALPALGCGHGGLDWDRVSGMIRDKLNGVDAHVLIFAPSASRRAGRLATEAPTDDERESATKLGYRLMEPGSVPALELSSPIYLLGKEHLLSRRWIALLPSRAPGEREMQALRSIAVELARSGSPATVALVHGAKVSEDIAQIFIDQGIETLLLLPFGVLARKTIARQPAMEARRLLTLASAASANAKWSRQLFAQAQEMLRTNAAAMLLSDPGPDWLTSNGLSKWAHLPISYVRYEMTPSHMREALAGVGARPIARRAEDGSPNIEYLARFFDAASTTLSAGAQWPELKTGTVNQPCSPMSQATDGPEVVTFAWDKLSKAARRNLIKLLSELELPEMAISLSMPTTLAEASKDRLRQLLPKSGEDS